MFSNRGYNWYLGVLSVLFIAIFIIIPLYKNYYGGGLVPRSNPVAEKIKNEIKSEYALIPPFPGATLMKTEYFGKDGDGSLFSSFSSKSNLQDVLNYYDKQFKDNGWTFKQIVVMKTWFWGEDTDRRQVEYTKGQYLVEIGYSENDRIGQNNTFAVAI